VSPYQRDDSGGSGPYKATYKADPALPKHTIYYPKTPPSFPMPIIVWGEGACASQGTAFVNLLTEISSHGYLILANGPPGKPGSPFGTDRGKTSASMLTQSMDWITKKNGDGGRYGKLDKTKIAAAGQSCGGMEAWSVSGDPRVKLTGMFNSGLFGSSGSSPLFAKMNHPVAYFLGGSGDIAYQNGERDYKLLPATTPAIKFNMPGAGHGGTYGEKQAGSFGKAAVAFFEYGFKGDPKAKAAIFDGGLKKLGFEIQHKNWKF